MKPYVLQLLQREATYVAVLCVEGPRDAIVVYIQTYIQWRINHDANDAMAWGPPLKGAPRAAVWFFWHGSYISVDCPPGY